MSLSIGVLMIGSLYWDEVRARWRGDRYAELKGRLNVNSAKSLTKFLERVIDFPA